MAPARRRAGDWAILPTLSLGFFMTLLGRHRRRQALAGLAAVKS